MLLPHICGILITFGLSALLIYSQALPFMYEKNILSFTHPLMIISMLTLYWTFNFCFYFNQVFISAIVSNHLEGYSNVLSLSIVSAVNALGSVAIGSFALGFLFLIKTLNIIKTYKKNYSGNSTGIYKYWEKLIVFLHNIVYFTNLFVFTYIGFFQTSFKDALINSYYTIKSSKYKISLGYLGFESILNILLFLLGLITLLLSYFVDHVLVKNQYDFSREIVVGIIICIICLEFFYAYLKTFLLSIVFKAIMESKEIEEKDPELFRKLIKENFIVLKEEYVENIFERDCKNFEKSNQNYTDSIKTFIIKG